MSRRAFFGIALAVAATRRSYRLRAIAAEHMPHEFTLRSSDPKIAAHFAKGGIFEVREIGGRRDVRLFDSLQARWSSRENGPAPSSISLYRPA